MNSKIVATLVLLDFQRDVGYCRHTRRHAHCMFCRRSHAAT